MNKKKIIIIASILVLAIVGTITYALWTNQGVQTKENIVDTGCFEISFAEAEEPDDDGYHINLDGQLPTKLEDINSLEPYTFTITNKCTIAANYTVYLNTLPGSNISNKGIGARVNLFGPKSLEEYNLNNEYDTSKYQESHELVSGTLKAASARGANDGGSKTYDVRLYITEDAPESDMGKSFEGKIVVESDPKMTLSKDGVVSGDISLTEECGDDHSSSSSSSPDDSGDGSGNQCRKVTGNSVYYNLFENGDLVISGTGKMKSFVNYDMDLDDEIPVNLFANLILKEYINSYLSLTQEEEALLENDYLVSLVFMLSKNNIYNYSPYLSGDEEEVDYYYRYNSIDEVSDNEILSFMDEYDLVNSIDTIRGLVAKLDGFPGIKNVTINDGVTSIRPFTFANLIINNFDMGNTISSIELMAFFNSSLNNISFSNSLYIIGELAFVESKLGSLVTLPNSLKRIEDGAFEESNLRGKLVIPNSVIDIYESAFRNTKISSVKLPKNQIFESVNIGDIFRDSDNLKTIYIPTTIIEISNSYSDQFKHPLTLWFEGSSDRVFNRIYLNNTEYYNKPLSDEMLKNSNGDYLYNVKWSYSGYEEAGE